MLFWFFKIADGVAGVNCKDNTTRNAIANNKSKQWNFSLTENIAVVEQNH